MLPLCLNSSQKRVHRIPQRKAPNTCGSFGLAAVWRVFFQRKNENKRQKGEEEKTFFFHHHPSAPPLAFFVNKNWNDETRTAITAHSPPLSPMQVQVTNEPKKEVFQLTKSLQSSLPQEQEK